MTWLQLVLSSAFTGYQWQCRTPEGRISLLPMQQAPLWRSAGLVSPNHMELVSHWQYLQRTEYSGPSSRSLQLGLRVTIKFYNPDPIVYSFPTDHKQYCTSAGSVLHNCFSTNQAGQLGSEANTVLTSSPHKKNKNRKNTTVWDAMPQCAQIKYDEHTRISVCKMPSKVDPFTFLFIETMIKTYMLIRDCLQDEGNLYVIYLLYKYYRELTFIP